MKVATGKSILKGIAIGPLRIYRKKAAEARRASVLSPAEELARFESARREAQEQLGALYDKALDEVGVETLSMQCQRYVVDGRNVGAFDDRFAVDIAHESDLRLDSLG